MIAIYKRELKSYFSSAIGYVFLAVFYLFAGFFFMMYELQQNSANMTSLYSSLIVIFVFLIPVLTMRLLCEEKKQKTDQLLLTSPVSLFGMVFGKFLAALTIYALGLAVTVVYSFVLALFVQMDTFVILGNILGELLLGAGLIAIGVFISNLTENQVIAAVASFFIMLMLYFVDTVSSMANNHVVSVLLNSISIYSRFSNFSLGILNLGDTVYYFSLAAVFLFLTVRVLEKRRWS